MRNSARTWAAFAAAATITLAGCGGGSGGSGGGDEDEDFAEMSAADIQAAATKDMTALESVAMSGTLMQEGGELSLDLQLNKEGECEGTLSQGGGTAEFIGTGDESFLKGDETFWVNSTGSPEAAQQVLTLLGDKWAKIPPEQADFAALCDIDQLLDELEDEDTPEGEKGEETEVDGQSAIEITTESDDGGTTVALVAIDDPHYILEVTKEGGEESGSFTFSQFDEEVAVEAPPADEVVDLAEQMG